MCIIIKNYGCPCCVRKCEGLVAELLKYKFVTFSKEWNPIFLGSKRMDFYVAKINTCFEIDGLQHFRQVWNWKSPEEQQCNDIDKMKKCFDKGISIIRIYQPLITIIDDSWKSSIFNSIKYIIQSIEPVVIFQNNISEYDIYREKCDSESLKYLSL